MAADGKRRCKHWKNAAHQPTSVAPSPAVQRDLSSRSRSEIKNNAILGVVDANLAVDSTGTVPALQFTLNHGEVNEGIEISFIGWSTGFGLARMLRRSVESWVESKEGFLGDSCSQGQIDACSRIAREPARSLWV